MRKINFRGKRIEDDKWIYGYYWYVEEHYANPIKNKIHFIKSKNNGIDYKIDVYTLGQYTGLIDINGKEIFEGDIVKCKKMSNEHIVVVEWATLLAGYHLRYLDKYTYLCELCFAEDVEVIGNRYDNPELVGGKIK